MASSSSEHAAKPEETGGGESSEARPPPDQLLLYRGLKKAKKERGCTAKERISRMPPCTAGKRSSIYRGVTRHRWTGRYEAHLWDKSTWNQNQNKKGKQVYLGAYDDEEAAARAYDLAALKYWGPGTLINFPVTDYARDLEEMQNVSREDYLASLRRKSSGFSRGISKYRPLSSRWDSQFGRTPGTDYNNNALYGDEAATGSENAGVYNVERKIDLSNYIKWWGTSKSSLTDFQSKAVVDETNPGGSDDVASELKALERSIQPTEPYEMPRLGVSPERLNHKKISAMSTLLKSAAYKSLQERITKKQGKDENDENENKSNIDKIELGKTVEKSCHDGASERRDVAYGINGGLPIHRYQLAPLLSAPLLTNYNSIDPLTDPLLWSSLVPVLPTGSSRMNEVTKNESSSGYTFFQQGE
ncbi:AP2-like ethylene-responsive transcription factor At2g41710 isoform X2 [Salvia miltiorrhiza]|uniref:AP9/EREBP Transcription Factors n=1 Tax=Salvia miltiorrhiza TaxID=226208 RepID=A0A0G2SJP0_SALMI|nr:AP2-like ethylene-responsive transcription factor At2g41710 isoform X2 [Salvia miltiorrhiza]AJQ20652.1 AP9/EREBP Transcription Factors [Salvia miltiorrhiza]